MRASFRDAQRKPRGSHRTGYCVAALVRSDDPQFNFTKDGGPMLNPFKIICGMIGWFGGLGKPQEYQLCVTPLRYTQLRQI